MHIYNFNTLVYINVSSFSSISYYSYSEYWTQKRVQSESIDSTILDVHVLKAEHFNSLSFHSHPGNKSSRDPISDRESWPTTIMEDRLRHASGPVHIMIPLHKSLFTSNTLLVIYKLPCYSNLLFTSHDTIA